MKLNINYPLDLSEFPLSITHLTVLLESMGNEYATINNIRRDDLITIIEALKFYFSIGSDLKSIKHSCEKIEEHLCQKK